MGQVILNHARYTYVQLQLIKGHAPATQLIMIHTKQARIIDSIVRTECLITIRQASIG